MTAVVSEGKFITLEGGEGAGKSTSREFIVELLTANKIPFVQTREPGGTPLSESLRSLLLAKDGTAPSVEAELLMVFAARAQHLNEVIEPALAQGQWVLCDRFTDATYAYQGYGRGFDLAAISLLETMVQKDRHPDLTLLFDLDPRIGIERAQKRAELDRFESEELAFFERVRQGYLERAESNERFVVIDAARPVSDVQASVRQALELFLEGTHE
ncbi:MAG: dTMP kinase [Proteobacteria bacterium]|nr:MAG: dTMP kinase [Pseudomonadota bacterium]